MSERAACAHRLAGRVRRARSAPGVACVLTAADIPGENDASPVFARRPGVRRGRGPVCRPVAVRGRGRDRSRRRAPPRGWRGSNTRTCRRSSRSTMRSPADRRPAAVADMRLGDADAALRRRAAPAHRHARMSAARIISTWKARSPTPSPARAATCWSTPRRSIRARSSTTSPRCSALPDNAVTVEVRRMGGGFGGKETQPALFAAIAALAAAQDRPAGQAPRSTATTTWSMTGKRHDFRIDYDVGFDGDGRIAGVALRPCGALRLFRGSVGRASPTAPCSTPTMPMRCTTRSSIRAG